MIAFRTVSGRRINLEAPSTKDIRLTDIASGLSKCCRFAGQVHEFYSVAQHSVLVSFLVPDYLKWAALLHDSTEAYMGDLSRHLKHHDALAGYRRLEAQLDGVITRKFKIVLSDEDRQLVKLADDLSAIWEHWVLRRRMAWYPEAALLWAKRVQFVKSPSPDLLTLAYNGDVPRQEEFMPLPPKMAEAMFLLQTNVVKGLAR